MISITDFSNVFLQICRALGYNCDMEVLNSYLSDEKKFPWLWEEIKRLNIRIYESFHQTGISHDSGFGLLSLPYI